MIQVNEVDLAIPNNPAAPLLSAYLSLKAARSYKRAGDRNQCLEHAMADLEDAFEKLEPWLDIERTIHSSTTKASR